MKEEISFSLFPYLKFVLGRGTDLDTEIRGEVDFASYFNRRDVAASQRKGCKMQATQGSQERPAVSRYCCLQPCGQEAECT